MMATAKTGTILAAALAMSVMLASCDKPAKPEPAKVEPAADKAAPPAPVRPVRNLVVGYSVLGSMSDWRRASIESIQHEAVKRGVELKFADAQMRQDNQIAALREFVRMKVDVIAFSPVVSTGWDEVLGEIKAGGIPVILLDREVYVSDESLYVAVIAADFVEEGRQAGRWLAKKMNGKAAIAELTGTPGSPPALDRKAGFDEVLRGFPDMKIIKSQTGNFTRAGGKAVMEQFLKSPDGKRIDALYAHNDDMALGAIQAIEEAGLKPGTDIVIVSIDAVRGALEAIVGGKLNCTVECSPLVGPQLFDAIEKIVAHKKVNKRIGLKEGVFDQTTAKEALPKRKY